MSNFLAALLGIEPATFEARLDDLMASCDVDTTMPPVPTDAEWQAVTGQTWQETNARIDYLIETGLD